MAAIVAAALLVACAGSDMAGLVNPAAAPQPAPPAVTDPAPPPPGRARPDPAPAVPAAGAPAPSAKLTTEQINTECWMRADSDRRLRDIDARLAYVKRCVAERTGSR